MSELEVNLDGNGPPPWNKWGSYAAVSPAIVGALADFAGDSQTVSNMEGPEWWVDVMEGHCQATWRGQFALRWGPLAWPKAA